MIRSRAPRDSQRSRSHFLLSHCLPRGHRQAIQRGRHVNFPRLGTQGLDASVQVDRRIQLSGGHDEVPLQTRDDCGTTPCPGTPRQQKVASRARRADRLNAAGKTRGAHCSPPNVHVSSLAGMDGEGARLQRHDGNDLPRAFPATRQVEGHRNRDGLKADFRAACVTIKMKKRGSRERC